MRVSKGFPSFSLCSTSDSGIWGPKYGNKGKYDGDPETDPMSSGDFMEEDVYACEQQQKSLTSPYFSVGAVAKRGEYAIAKFQLEVKKWIEKHNNNE